MHDRPNPQYCSRPCAGYTLWLAGCPREPGGRVAPSSSGQGRFMLVTLPVTLYFALVWLITGANIASLLMTETWQTLYDRLAATLVVYKAVSRDR